MIVPVTVKYREGFFPTPRHRRLHFRDAEVESSLRLHQLSDENAPVACIVHGSMIGSPYGGEQPVALRYEASTGRWWQPAPESSKPDELARGAADVRAEEVRDAAHALEAAQAKLAGVALTPDGACWMPSAEPFYEVRTFGLGYNHGGVGLSIGTYARVCDERAVGAVEVEQPGDQGYDPQAPQQGAALARKRLFQVAVRHGARPEQAQASVENADERIEVLTPAAFQFHRPRQQRTRLCVTLELEVDGVARSEDDLARELRRYLTSELTPACFGPGVVQVEVQGVERPRF